MTDTSAFPSVYAKKTLLVTQRFYPLTIWTTENKKKPTPYCQETKFNLRKSNKFPVFDTTPSARLAKVRSKRTIMNAYCLWGQKYRGHFEPEA